MHVWLKVCPSTYVLYMHACMYALSAGIYSFRISRFIFPTFCVWIERLSFRWPIKERLTLYDKDHIWNTREQLWTLDIYHTCDIFILHKIDHVSPRWINRFWIFFFKEIISLYFTWLLIWLFIIFFYYAKKMVINY